MRQAEPGSLDVIIVDSTDPVGPARALHRDFYADCLRALGPGGSWCSRANRRSTTADPAEMHAAMRAAGFADTKTLFFPQTIYPSGWWSATLARKGAAIDGFRAEAAATRGFETLYYNADIHQAALAEPEFFRSRRGAKGLAVRLQAQRRRPPLRRHAQEAAVSPLKGARAPASARNGRYRPLPG
jgi:spermidine synthase